MPIAYTFRFDDNGNLLETKALLRGEWVERQYPGSKQFDTLLAAEAEIRKTFKDLGFSVIGLTHDVDIRYHAHIIACMVSR